MRENCYFLALFCANFYQAGMGIGNYLQKKICRVRVNLKPQFLLRQNVASYTFYSFNLLFLCRITMSIILLTFLVDLKFLLLF